MKVYIVITHDCEECDNVAVFAMKSDADELVKKCEEYNRKRFKCTLEPSNPEAGTVSCSDFAKNHPAAKYVSNYINLMEYYGVECHELHAILLS